MLNSVKMLSNVFYKLFGMYSFLKTHKKNNLCGSQGCANPSTKNDYKTCHQLSSGPLLGQNQKQTLGRHEIFTKFQTKARLCR